MKKIILFLTLLITSFCVFAEEDVNIKKDPYFKGLVIPKGVTVLNTLNEQKLGEIKTNLYLLRKKKEDFLKQVRSDGNLKVFPSASTVSMEEILVALKQEKKILDTPEDAFFTKYIWYESNTDGISAKFNQTGLWGRIYGFGSYEISVFIDDYVYTFYLFTPMNVEERNSPMDGLSEYMYFKKGRVTDNEKGIDGNQGYRWKEKSAIFEEKYYNDLSAKKKTLPKEVLDFQIAYEELIQNIIKNFE